MNEAMKSNCNLCGEPMPEGEEMFKFHGYSGPCPKPYLKRAAPPSDPRLALFDQMREALKEIADCTADGCTTVDAWRGLCYVLCARAREVSARIDALEKGEGK